MNLNQKAASISVAISLGTLITWTSFTAQASESAALGSSADSARKLEAVAQVALSEEAVVTPSDEAALPDSYILEAGKLNEKSPRMEIAVRKAWETGHSAVYINNKEVVRFRTEAGGVSPYGRAKKVAAGLNDFLLKGGSPRDIKPGLEGNQVVIRTGEAVLLTVDSATAGQCKSNPRTLALQWTNRIRQALGADGADRTVASRGLFGGSRELLAPYRSTGVLLTGMASWYGPGFHGRRSANGSRFNMYDLTAAHRSLPFGTLVKVMNHRTGKSCVVKITDRGPFHGNRIIDLSKGAASAIGLLGSGVGRVSIEVLSPLLRR